ncbi:MAG: GNAT family N-acetyltransferase [Synechococcaceae cyanobacterium SM2_3_1]|nr:GNAT family N-acetyltransferase [Synechococcaceae cyanobacterium SM2_3_1]
MKDAFSFILATTPVQVRAYYDLRHQIFCNEQGLFAETDRDAWDTVAYPIVALQVDGSNTVQVVGVVRIYETEPGIWYGGRLGVDPDFRRQGQIGKGLIHKAVTTAHGWGCKQFLATVQLQNVRFFRRLHWQTLSEISLLDRPHHLMQANQAAYPPEIQPRPMLEWAEVS